MNTLSRYFIITLSILVLCTSISCSNSSDEQKIDVEKSSTQKDNMTAEKAKNTQQKDTSMQALEDIQVDINDPENFLAMNAKKDGVIVTESGLQYRVLKQGTGPKPTTDSKVQVHYRGAFPDGQEFDSSYKRGEPAVFPVTGVIAGWTEALLLMNEGTTCELIIPPELAYGKRGAGNIIPPDQILKFEVELIKADYKD